MDYFLLYSLKFKVMKYFLLFFLSLITFSCKEDLQQAEDEIIIEVGQTIPRNILGEHYEITLNSVDENSLCPKTLYCFWGGRIIVTLRINSIEYQLGNGDEKILNELLIGNKKLKIIDAYDYVNDESQWIKLRFEMQ